jgi:hypothetical protein
VLRIDDCDGRGEFVITFASVVEDLVRAFPELEAFSAEHCYDALRRNSELAYVIFGDVFRPFIERAMDANDIKMLKRVGCFLEEASRDAAHDPALSNLLAIEIGEWLDYVEGEDRIGSYIGAETKRITGYVPGLATQRRKAKGLPC